ncbi:potassium channel family protein [Candidatus Omnitrophota bacterium]
MKKGGLYYLLISLLFILFVYPIFENWDAGSKFFAVFVSFILVSGVYVVTRESRWKFFVSMILAAPAMVLLWTEEFIDLFHLEIAAFTFMLLFGFFTVYCILSHVMKAQKVDTNILAGAASAYLLIGISWSFIYCLLSLIMPGSFNIPEALPHGVDNIWSTFNYYSFTTLTTLGYGDITPVTPRAQSFALLEAVIGVLFSALLMAKLVGTYLYHQMQKEKGE